MATHTLSMGGMSWSVHRNAAGTFGSCGRDFGAEMMHEFEEVESRRNTKHSMLSLYQGTMAEGPQSLLCGCCQLPSSGVQGWHDPSSFLAPLGYVAVGVPALPNSVFVCTKAGAGHTGP